MAPVTVLPFSNPYLVQANRPVDLLKLSKDELGQAIVCITKALAICPGCKLWSRLADIYARLWVVEDDSTCLKESWTQKLEADRSWPPRLIFLCRQTKVLNLMIQSSIRQSIRRAAPVADQQHLARAWFERKLELLVLMMLRRRYFAKLDGKLHLRRCQHLALSLIWFLVHCTDYGDVIPACREALQKAVLKLPEEWQGFAGRAEPLLCFRSGALGSPPAYLWYVPYVMGRIEWKLRKQLGAHASAEAALGYLSDACNMENEVHTLMESMSQRGLLARTYQKSELAVARERSKEPHFRCEVLRVKLCMEAEGWRLAATRPRIGGCETLMETLGDAVEALDTIANLENSYKPKVAIIKACLDLHLKDFDDEKAAEHVRHLQGSSYIFDEQSKYDPAGSSIAGGYDPWVVLEQRQRKVESQRLKALFASLSIYKALLLNCLPKGAEVSVPTDLKTFQQLEAKRSLTDLHGDCEKVPLPYYSKVVSEMEKLKQNRPEHWKDLFLVTLALVRSAISAAESSDRHLLRSVLITRALREGCLCMAKAGMSSRKGRWDFASSRPHVDMRIFSLFMRFCERLESLSKDENTHK
ncbi:unnamed protein product, partial [Durusdinium trenchii]